MNVVDWFPLYSAMAGRSIEITQNVWKIKTYHDERYVLGRRRPNHPVFWMFEPR